MLTPRLPVRISPPWEKLGEASFPSLLGRGLGRLPYYCSRRDAADEMPLKALVLIFVSLPPFTLFGVRGKFFCCCWYCSLYDVLLLRKSFYCVCCHFLGFCKGVVRQQVIRRKGVTGVTANLKWIQKCFLGIFLFTMPLCASYCSMQRKGTSLRRTFSMST